ncbi:MAG TPA: glycosyltransferase [Pseudonocardiaceae bacterium]|jgi:GT2 family glycosyltransferase/2-polyprenyl-3-methyl-5-hydroxy-6-metoxy-1,4-benzoquinol methylase|nr:glycosyltransferase [Pseudonocardiaceae bacterium]
MDDRRIEWTGERCVPWTDDLQVVYEHYHRYALAARFTNGARVLDLACGEGYGAALLAAGARDVVAVDIDPRTVEHATANYRGDNLYFTIGSMIDPELLTGVDRFDVITCFEALEHVEQQDTLIAVVRRLLAPGGLFLTSTPDVAVYSHVHGNDNPFHVRELTEPEFRALLGGSFGHVAILRQNVAAGSLIASATPGPAIAQSLRRAPDGGWRVAAEVPHTYLLGVASDAALPELPQLSVLVDPDLALVRDAHRALAEQRDRITQLSGELDDERRHAAAVEVTTTRQRQRLEGDVRRLGGELTGAQRRVQRAESLADWQRELAGEAQRRAAELELQVLALQAEQSATAVRLISRYRGTVERAAPRGTLRRDLYERALGRGLPAAAPEVAPGGPVALRTSTSPLLSIVVPVHGQWEYTQACLASIEAHPPTVPFEVLVVDDASPDRTAELVVASPGVRLVRTERNVGFVGACNLGASHARGAYLLFLNNDTEVRPGALDALVDAADSDDRIGLVGAMLVYPDGRLQESGGIVWADGSGWNYGRDHDAHAPEFAVRRDVDYCSGAAILVRQELFEGVGGFDQRYAPAYYEDTDLAFAIRATGHRSIVEPRAVVVHHEGVSHGTDRTGGVKRFQEINRAQFVDKWAATLAEHLPAASELNVWLARQRGPAGHHGGLVLVADHQVPMPDCDSGSLRMYRLLLQLVELGERVVFFPCNGALPQPYTADLQRHGITVIADAARQDAFLREAGAALRLAVLSRPQVGWKLLEDLRMRAPRCLVSYDTVDVHFLRLQRQAQLAASTGDEVGATALAGKAAASRELELGLVRAADVTLVVSEHEQALLRSLVPEADVRVLSNVHFPAGAVPGPQGRAGLLFVGSFDHLPNRDAVAWMVREVLPLVHRRHPGTVLHVVGSNPSPDVLALADDTVEVHGWVADLVPMHQRCRLSVAPLRFGAGVKGKVGESMAAGLPTVCTPVAAEGMGLLDGEHVLVAAAARGFADHVVALLDDDALWGTLSETGANAITDRFGPAISRAALQDVLATAAKLGS